MHFQILSDAKLSNIFGRLLLFSGHLFSSIPYTALILILNFFFCSDYGKNPVTFLGLPHQPLRKLQRPVSKTQIYLCQQYPSTFGNSSLFSEWSPASFMAYRLPRSFPNTWDFPLVVSVPLTLLSTHFERRVGCQTYLVISPPQAFLNAAASPWNMSSPPYLSLPYCYF